MLAAIVAAVVAPLGYAFSVESTTFVPAVAQSAPAVAGDRHGVQELPDAAQLFFAGTALFGLAAAVRKAF